jgi:hypothetical protein
VAKYNQPLPEMMSPAAGLHPDQARREIRELPHQLRAGAPPPKHDLTAHTQTDNVERAFADVDADCCNLHG